MAHGYGHVCFSHLFVVWVFPSLVAAANTGFGAPCTEWNMEAAGDIDVEDDH